MIDLLQLTININIITEFIHDLFVSIKAAMDLLSIAISLQLRCVYFYCPVNRAQARAAFMGLVWSERERHKLPVLIATRTMSISLTFPKCTTDISMVILSGGPRNDKIEKMLNSKVYPNLYNLKYMLTLQFWDVFASFFLG